MMMLVDCAPPEGCSQATASWCGCGGDNLEVVLARLEDMDTLEDSRSSESDPAQCAYNP